MTTPTKEQIKPFAQHVVINIPVRINWETVEELKMSIYCGNCKHNPMGICELCGKEIPESYVIRRNKLPVWCPLKKGKK